MKTISKLLKFGNGITGIKNLEGFEFLLERRHPQAAYIHVKFIRF